MTRLVVYGVPAPKGSMRAFTPKGWKRPIITDSNAKVKPWAAAVTAAAADALAVSPAPPLEGPVSLMCTFYVPCPKSAPKTRSVHPTKKPDVSKLARAVEDALTGVLWRDDAQVTLLVARKIYAGRQDDLGRVKIPRAEIEVRPDDGTGVSAPTGITAPMLPLTTSQEARR